MNVLRNIPPVWTAISQWGAAALVLAMLPRRARGWRFALLLLPFLAAQIGWMLLIGGLDGTPFNLGMGAAALLTLAPFLALGKRLQIWTRIYHCTRAFLLGGFTVSLAWQLYIWAEAQLDVLHGVWGEIAVMTALTAGLFAVFFFLERRQRETDAELEVTPAVCGMTLLLALLIYILSSVSFAPIATPFSGSTDIDAFNLRTWIYLCGTALLYGHHALLCEVQSRQELIRMQSILEMQLANYSYSKEAAELVNRKYHDLKHQIAVLRSTISSGEKLGALDRMEAEIRAYEAENKTGSEVLDIVLTGKAIVCQNSAIDLTVVADGTALAFMDWVDISNLFGNMLDNAIEAVRPLPAEQRLIHLSVARQRGFLCVMMENRYDREAEVGMRDGLPFSLRKNRQFHGFGLKSITATAKKYGGTASFRREEGWFRLRVLIPLPEEKPA